jgi:hypothetical protein
MAITDTLFKELAKNSVLLLSLHGVRTVLERELGIKNLQISMDETVKAEIERKSKQHEGARYPYSWLSMSELIGVKDQSNNKHAQRRGLRLGGGIDMAAGATKYTSRKAYLFPINVGMTMKYVDDDPVRAMVMAESMVILSMLGGLTFSLTLSETLSFDVRVEIPESVPIPLATNTSTESPGGIEVELSLIIHTYSGFFKNVEAVTSDRPTVNMTIELEDETIQTEV